MLIVINDYIIELVNFIRKKYRKLIIETYQS